MGVFKLGKMTFGSLFKKPETVLYPIQTKPQPAGLKGHIAIDVEACILCGMCDRSCATGCITVDKAQHYWEIDRFQCVQCGYCITVCPKKCLSMDPNYAPASTVHAADRIYVPVQEKAPAKEPKDAAAKAVQIPASEQKETKDATAQEGTAQEAEPSKTARDAVLESKLAIMDADKAQRVRDALAARMG